MIKETTIYDFKTHLSRYIHELEEGLYERIVIKRRNQPAIDVIVHEKPGKRKILWGALQGKSSEKETDYLADDMSPAYEEQIKHMYFGRIFPDEEEDPRLHMPLEISLRLNKKPPRKPKKP